MKLSTRTTLSLLLKPNTERQEKFRNIDDPNLPRLGGTDKPSSSVYVSEERPNMRLWRNELLARVVSPYLP